MTNQPGQREAHEQVLVSMPIYVDEAIVPLLENLWSMDYYTEWSCQGSEPEHHSGYVSFRHWGIHRGVVRLFEECSLPFPIYNLSREGEFTFEEGVDVYGVVDRYQSKSMIYFKPHMLDYLIEATLRP